MNQQQQKKIINPYNKYIFSAKLSLAISSILAIIVIISLWFIWSNLHNISSIKKNSVSQINSSKAELQTTQDDLTKIKNQMQNQTNEQKKLADSVNQTDNSNAINTNQVITLLQLAEIQIASQGKSDSTIELLQQSITIIKNTTTIDQSIATSINKILSKLKNNKQPQASNALANITSLNMLITNLSFTPATDDTTTQVTNNKDKDNKDSIYNTIKSYLKQLIVVRYHKTPTKPLQDAQAELLFKQAMLLKSNEARWAFMQNNSDIYLQSLSDITDQLSSTTLINTNQKNKITSLINTIKKTPPNNQRDIALQLNTITTKLINSSYSKQQTKNTNGGKK